MYTDAAAAAAAAALCCYFAVVPAAAVLLLSAAVCHRVPDARKMLLTNLIPAFSFFSFKRDFVFVYPLAVRSNLLL